MTSNEQTNKKGSQFDTNFSLEINEIRQSMNVLQAQLNLKSNIVDVCALVDLKADAVETLQAVENL